MTTIYLVRHGEYENPEYVNPGRTLSGFPLSVTGENQVERLSVLLQNVIIDVLFSSPIQRTRETAKILGYAMSLTPIVDHRLLEVRTGLDGTSMHEFDKTRGELSYLPEYTKQGAETMQELTERMVGFIEEKRREYNGKTVLIVTHGDPMRFAVMHYMGLPIDFEVSRNVAIPLAGGYRIEFEEGNEAKVYPIVAS